MSRGRGRPVALLWGRGQGYPRGQEPLLYPDLISSEITWAGGRLLRSERRQHWEKNLGRWEWGTGGGVNTLEQESGGTPTRRRGSQGPPTLSLALGSDTDVSSPEKILGQAEGALQRPAKGIARDRPGCQGRGLRSAGLGGHGSGVPGTAGSGDHTHMLVPLKLIRAQSCHSVESAPDSTHPDFNSWKVACWHPELPGHESCLLAPLVAARGCQLL